MNVKELINEYKKRKKEGYKTIQGDNEIVSLKKKQKLEQLESEIFDVSRNYILKVKSISEKYDVVDNKYSDMIREKSGYWEYKIRMDYKEYDSDQKHDYVFITYTDSWSYGGNCEENESVTFDELMNFNEEEFMEKCRQRKIGELKEENSRLLKRIKDNEKQIKDL